MKETNVKLTLQARANTLCPAKGIVIGLIDSGAAAFKTVIGSAKVNGLWPLYIDSEDRANMYALVREFTDGTEPIDDIDIEYLTKREYSVTITGRDGSNLTGFVEYASSVSASGNSEMSSELKGLIDEKIAAGIVTKEEMDARLKVMDDNHVDELLKFRVIKGYRKYNKPVHYPSTVYVDPYISDSVAGKTEGIVAEGLRHGVGRIAAICEGEKSVGKNVYIETVAWLMNMPTYLITFTRLMSPSSIYGEKTTDNSAAEALAKVDPSILALADKAEAARKLWMEAAEKSGMPLCDIPDYADSFLPEEWKSALKQKKEFELRAAQSSSVNIVIEQSELYDWLTDGGVMVFNEMNMAESNFFASFTNQLLDGTGFIFIAGRGEVSIHPDCVLFGTQNANYEGTEEQNEATMSRFNCIYFPQPKSILKQLVAAVTSSIKKQGSNEVLDKEYFKQAEAFYANCRKAVISGSVSNAVLNIRGFVRALSTVALSGGHARLKRWILLSVINTCPFEEREALSGFLDAIVTL